MTSSAVPYKTRYDHAKVQVGVVHVGFGAFHRAHQAVYIDDYMEATGDLNWGIAAVNLRDVDSESFAKSQIGSEGYVLKTTSPDGLQQVRIVRAHLKIADWATEAATAESLFAQNSVHVVSITVTESGYYLNDDMSLNTQDEVIANELAGGKPTSIYAFLCNSLSKRASAGGGPITVMCCDNIRGNGNMLERNLIAYLEAAGHLDLATWIRENVSFPNSMVDRITPRATSDRNMDTEGTDGLEAEAIHAEQFKQWVLEDRFADTFPDLRKAGVEIVTDVDPFEEAKIRILNGGHTALGYMAALSGYDTFDQAMRDPELKAHIDNWVTQEVLPAIEIKLPFDKYAYWHSVAERFNNQAIADQVERICMDGWSKMPIYIRPTLTACLEQKIPPRFGYDSVASWYVFARQIASGEIETPYHEPYWKALEPLLKCGNEASFAQEKDLWADLPTKYQEFVPSLVSAIKKAEEKWLA